ncbi:MAG: phenylalanine--tRNA ligase subunit beta, partial [Lachnospiraceae bacterium]
EVEDTKLCPRYCARMVKNIKIGPSPEWMQRRLAASGIRPINNIVDITNYVMEEFGQPMHAFDYEQISGKKIVVKCAEDGEEFQTLDGQIRKLDSSMLMIRDAQKAIGIAGIMGGENSKITDDVKTMVFEAACFDGTNIRLSAKKLGLRTDASGKFEKGLDPNNAKAAIDRACQLIEELGAGEVVGGIIDVYPNVREEKRVPFQPERMNALLGTNLSKEEMLGYFKPLELRYEEATNELIIPSFRQDLECCADIAEEVARFFGYDNIPVSLPTGEATAGKLTFKLRVENVAKDIAEFCGFSQAMTYSFESPKVFDKLLIPTDSELRKVVTILNPLGEDYSIMRTTPLNGMLTSLSTNYNRRNKNVRLYEIGNIYIPKAIPVTELPEERTQFTLGMYGDGDFFTMKGVVEEFFDKAGLHDKVKYDPNAEKSFLHPGRQANIIYNGVVAGYLGEIHPEVADNYNIGDRAYIAVLDMPVITEHASFDRKYTGIAKYPAVTRDISMVMKREILVGQIEEVIEKKGGKLLESYKLFDIYEGTQIMAGYKSVAYSITFRAKDHTLEDKEVNEVMNKILTALQELGIELRK